MYGILTVLHIIVCVLLILIVLLQAGKSGGFGGIFGSSGSSDALFSAPSGSSFMKKATSIIAVVFMFTCLLLTFLSLRRGMRTVTSAIPPMQAQSAPAQQTGAPAAAAPSPTAAQTPAQAQSPEPVKGK